MMALEPDEAAVDDHDGLVDGDEVDRRQADPEDRDRARGLHDEGQQGSGEKGEDQRVSASLHHVPEPRLIGERCRRLPEQYQAEDDHGPAEERCCDGAVIGQPLGGHHGAGNADDIERHHLDIEGDDHDQPRHADTAAQDRGKSALYGDQPRSQDAHHDEGQCGHGLGDAAGERSPEKRRIGVRGPALRAQTQPPARELLEVLGQEPHADDEQAEPAHDACENVHHAFLAMAV